MRERRGSERTALTEPGVGEIRLVQDVEIAELGRHEITVVAPGPVARGERLLLEVPNGDGTTRTSLVFAVENRFMLHDGRLKRQVLLRTVPRAGEAAEDDECDELSWRTNGEPLMGALTRRVPVRLVEMSRTGCLCESPAQVEEGRVGFLGLRNTHGRRVEAVRICRAWRTGEGLWPQRLALQFLTIGLESPNACHGVATVMNVGELSE